MLRTFQIRLLAVLFTGGAVASPGTAQIVPQTPPPSEAAPVPESAAEANARAVPGPPTTHVERNPTPGQPDTLVTVYPSNLSPPPPAAFNKVYPLCSETVQDSCRNPGTAEEPSGDEARLEALRPPRD